jgi:hypothetical protein
LEIEFEGPGFIQEYKAALAYLGIAGGAQTRLEDTGFDALPKQAVKHQAASHPPMTLAPLLSSMKGSKVESEFEKSEFGIESQGHSLQEYESSASQSEAAKPSQYLQFSVLGRDDQLHERGVQPQSTERTKETNPPFEIKSDRKEGAFPSGMNDEKFKDVLKRLGLSL